MPMNPKGMFAVIGRNRHSRGGFETADRWRAVAIGRETPQRLYANATKPTRWGSDNFTETGNAIARFDTAEEARAWLDAVLAKVRTEMEAYLAAIAATAAAREAASKAQQDLQNATNAVAKEALHT